MSRGALVAVTAGLVAALLAGFLVARGPASSGDSGSEVQSETRGPTTSTVVRLENERVKVVENRYDPGSESALHTHPDPRVVFVLAGGSVRLIAEDGSETDVVLEPGMTLWRPAETHVVRNTGRTVVRLLEMEVRAER